MPMSRLRAVVELLLPIPAAVIGSLVVCAIVGSWSLPDKRWLLPADNFGMGFGAVLCCALLLRLAGHRDVTIGWTGSQFVTNVILGLAVLFATYLVLVQVVFVAVILYPDLLSGPSTAQKAIEASLPPMPVWAVMLMGAFVAFWEEVVFRGFLLTRLQAVLRRWWLTVPLGALIFGVIHPYQGPLAMAVIAVLGLVMGLLFVWRKSLVPVMTYHLVHDVLMLQLLRSVSSTWE